MQCNALIVIKIGQKWFPRTGENMLLFPRGYKTKTPGNSFIFIIQREHITGKWDSTAR
jgi:hypothetical protein